MRSPPQGLIPVWLIPEERSKHSHTALPFAYGLFHALVAGMKASHPCWEYCGNVVLCKQPKWWVRKANCITWLPQSNDLHASWPAPWRGSESGCTKSFTSRIKWKGGSLLFMLSVSMVGWCKRCWNDFNYSNEVCMHSDWEKEFSCSVLSRHTRITQSDQRIIKSRLFGPYMQHLITNCK